MLAMQCPQEGCHCRSSRDPPCALRYALTKQFHNRNFACQLSGYACACCQSFPRTARSMQQATSERFGRLQILSPEAKAGIPHGRRSPWRSWCTKPPCAYGARVPSNCHAYSDNTFSSTQVCYRWCKPWLSSPRMSCHIWQ